MFGNKIITNNITCTDVRVKQNYLKDLIDIFNSTIAAIFKLFNCLNRFVVAVGKNVHVSSHCLPFRITYSLKSA
jgi:hypothetical protein